MALIVRCQCANTYDLKDEYAGQLVRCPSCQAVSRADRAQYTPASQADPAFDRDVFLLDQARSATAENYEVCDETGAAIVVAHQPVHRFRELLAGFVAAGTAAGLFNLVTTSAAAHGGGAGSAVILMLGGVAAVATLVCVRSALSMGEQLTLHRQGRSGERLLEVRQDRRVELVAARYTVIDAHGQSIARLHTSRLYNVLRTRWEIRTVAGQLAFAAAEDSTVRSVLRRIVGPIHPFLRTNVVLYAPDRRGVLGTLDRKAPILDRYALDLTRDRHRKLDRRVALAVAVMAGTD